MKVQLVIKGNSKDAYQEAEKLGLNLLNVRALRMAETVAETEAGADLLNRWYTRDIPVDDNGNFPAGSLLLWSEIKE